MSSSELKTLLVEDSKLISARLLELIVQTPGVTASSVVDTEADAISAINREMPDVIILDLQLRQGSGFGVMRHVNTMSMPPIVVVLTNYALPQFQAQVIALGAYCFLDKSREFERLPEVLAELHARRQVAQPVPVP